MSYSSNALPGPERIVQLLRDVKRHVEVTVIPHRYSFGTHSSAVRTSAHEYIFIGRD
jgi:DNA adenine methylase/adenine-specific DNA-methyltransferase